MWTANQVADWFLVKHSSVMERDGAIDEQLTQMKIHKLLYYAQGVYLALFNTRLFDEELLAWQHGPVVRSIYDRFHKDGAQINISNDEKEQLINDFDDISKNENSNMVLVAVYEKFGQYSASQLRNMTHLESPWKNAWGETQGHSVISDEDIRSYFIENIVEGA